MSAIGISLAGQPPLEQKHKRFGNGDSYTGGWKIGMPSGEGKYTWADGSIYSGGWKDGAKHGVGNYLWPSGASYHGEWQSGYMHGVGSFEAPDGSRYSGGWRKDVKHGLGKKVYANGDCYEGLWDSGRPNGPGRYVWVDGNEYDGEWRAGRMEGQGTFVWSTGERYDGGWKDGREHGLGLFTFPDGSTYRGFWDSGKKHGVGVQRPQPLGGAGSGPLEHHGGGGGGSGRAARAAGSADWQPGSPRGPSGGGGGGAAGADGFESGARGGGAVAAAPPGKGHAAEGLAARVVVVKEYDHGRLLRQSLLRGTEAEEILGKPDRRKRLGAIKSAAKQKMETTRLGQVVFKDNSSYDLMVGLQAGIRWSVTRDLSLADGLPPARPPPPAPGRGPSLPGAAFSERLVVPFPRGGSGDTPVHRASSDFEWREYCPAVFRSLREAFGWDPSSLVQELCSEHGLRLLNSPGKSGSVFFLSSDDKLLVKTIRSQEAALLRRLLAQYYAHMLAHPNSLLVRVFGLYSIASASSGGRKVRFVVMNNLFNTSLQIHLRYDLKGSTVGRSAGKEAVDKALQGDPRVVLKDLDLGGSAFKLEAQWHEKLMEQLDADCSLLESCGVMDYSMLLGVHDRARGNDGAASQQQQRQRQQQQQQGSSRAGSPMAPANGGGGSGRDDGGGAGEQGQRGGGSGDDCGGGDGGDGGGGGGEAQGEAWDGAVAAAAPAVNFQEYSANQEGLQRRLARVEARVALLDLGPEAKKGLLQLARVEMLSSGAALHPRGRGGRALRRSTSSVVATRPARSDTMRPVALADGASDALALCLGQSRVQLGAAMAATAVRAKAEPSQDPPANGPLSAAVAAAGADAALANGLAGEEGDAAAVAAAAAAAVSARDVVLFFGIIDIFTVYSATKRIEHACKAIAGLGRGGGRAVSAVPPGQYARRFKDFMRRVFV